MPFESPATDIAEPDPDPTPTIGHRTLDRDVSGILQDGELLGQRRIGQSELIADE